MKISHEYDASRRRFITSVVPVCAAACLVNGNSFALAQTDRETTEQTKHKFDQKLEQELTFSKYFAIRYQEFIQLSTALEKEWGKDKLIDFLKKNTKERMFQYGQNQAQKIGDNSMKAYVKQFRPPSYENLLTHEIVEDTDTVFEIKVTECIWAKTFIDAGIGDIGFAHICYGDYSWTEGFNPNMKMDRDKTLMQGQNCCNHRYSMVG